MATDVTAERSSPQTVQDSFDEYGCEEYPSSDGDRICESQYQYFAIFDTIGALKSMFADRPDVVVAGNLFVYYREGDPGSRVAPDILVMFGASGKHYRHSWQVWREGGVVPSFVLEVASESTWRTDAGPKRDIYAAMGVTEYWRHDPEPQRQFLPSALIGERLVDGEYRPMSVYTDGSGYLRGHSQVLGLDICVRDGSDLRLYDPSAEQWLLSPDEKETALQEQSDELREKADELREAQTQIDRLRARLESHEQES